MRDVLPHGPLAVGARRLALPGGLAAGSAGTMPRAGRLASRARRAVLAGALAAGLAATAAGCGSSPAKVTLPSKPPRVRVAAAPPAKPSARQRVIAAYQGYWRATSAAVDSRSPARARAILADYIPASAIPGLVRGLRTLWQRDETSYGSPVLHIMSVAVWPDGTAAVHDCGDLAHAGLADRRTGQIVGGLGQSHDNLITKLVLERGRWLVAGEIPVVQACAY